MLNAMTAMIFVVVIIDVGLRILFLAVTAVTLFAFLTPVIIACIFRVLLTSTLMRGTFLILTSFIIWCWKPCISEQGTVDQAAVEFKAPVCPIFAVAGS